MKLLITMILTLFVGFPISGQTAPASPASVQDDDQPIKINTLLVNIPVIASDRDGRNITGLTRDNFIIRQDGEKQPIEFFADQEAPVNVAIMIDTSGSTLRIIDDIKSAARSFVKVLRPEDKALVVSFDGQFKILSDLTANHKSLDKGIDKARLVQLENFSMYDALYDVVKNKFAGVPGRKAIILLTDGGEFGFRISRQQLTVTLSESDTVIYPILFKSEQPLPKIESLPKIITLRSGQKITSEEFLKGLKESANKGLLFVQSLGTMTGGKFYESRAEDFKQTFQNIADELKKQYLIGFYPQNVDDGKSHRIAVEVNPKNIVIRTKRLISLKTSH